MMRNFVGYYNNAQEVLEKSKDQKVSWNQLREFTIEEKERLSQMKFEEPSKGEEHCVSVYKQLQEDISHKFKSFGDQFDQ